MPAAMLTSKGQITIPQAVRVALGLHTGTRRTGKVLAQKLLIQAQQIQRDRQTRPVNAIVLPGCGMVITDHPLATGRVTGAFVGGYGLAAPIKPQDKQNGKRYRLVAPEHRMIDIRQLQGNLEHLNLGHVKTSFSRRKQAVALTRAAEYEHGVRTKVQTSRNDPRPAVADDEWQRIRAAKLAERQGSAGGMSCATWRILRRPEYREYLDAIEAWIDRDSVSAAVAMWLLTDDQVEQLADPNFPRRPSTRVAGAQELVAHENYIVYFDQDESNCSITVRAVVHGARQFT